MFGGPSVPTVWVCVGKCRFGFCWCGLSGGLLVWPVWVNVGLCCYGFYDCGGCFGVRECGLFSARVICLGFRGRGLFGVPWVWAVSDSVGVGLFEVPLV